MHRKQQLLLAGSIPEGNDGASGVVRRIDNDAILAEGFGWLCL